MTKQKAKAEQFHKLHEKGNPLVLYNIWDAGGARALAAAGAPAVATGSWSVAAAHGYDDGEQIPLDLLLQIAERIARTVSVPLSVDFEAGFAATPAAIAANVSRVLAAGAAGINFEDQLIDGSGLVAVEDQCARIAAIRAVARVAGIPLFINARTDVFLLAPADADPTALLPKAMERQAAYARAGADGFFLPGLSDPALIAAACEQSTLPVNVMMNDQSSVAEMAGLGVSRASYGPNSYRAALADLVARQQQALGS